MGFPFVAMSCFRLNGSGVIGKMEILFAKREDRERLLIQPFLRTFRERPAKGFEQTWGVVSNK